jgi:phosphate acetyltransferase
MRIIEHYLEKVKGRDLVLVLPEGDDERVVKAARIIKDRGIAEPILLGNNGAVAKAKEQAGEDLADIEIIDPKASGRLEGYIEKYRVGREDMSEGIARRLVSRPLFFAGMMVKEGVADAMVGGVAHATASLIQAGVLTIGLLPGITTVSSYFLMVIPKFQGETNKQFIYADCAVNIDPSAEELADIALASASSAAKLLTEKVHVALLSYATRGSATGSSVDKIKTALKLAQERNPSLAIDGEFQADTAIISRVAAKKVKDHSEVAGKANVLIFPDLNAGNISYKLTQYMADAQAIGPFLQGFAKPITDLSRGASVEDIITAATITLAQV